MRHVRAALPAFLLAASPAAAQTLDPFGGCPLVFFDAIRVAIRDEGFGRNKAVYIALGILPDGTKEVLGIWIEQKPNARTMIRGIIVSEAGRQVLAQRHERAQEPRGPDILIAVVDGLKGFPDAINAAFPGTVVQTCIVHLLRNSMSFASWKDRKPIASALRAVYRAETAEAALAAPDAFEAGHWGKRHPAIALSWRRHWDQVIPFFAFPEGLRRIIYTTDGIDKTSGAGMCYGLRARATPWRRAEHRMRVPPGRLITALPTWSVRAPSA